MLLTKITADNAVPVRQKGECAEKYYADVVTQQDPLFEKVQVTTNDNYQNTLGFGALSLPPRFVAIHSGGKVVASAGMYLANEKPCLTAETMTQKEERSVLYARLNQASNAGTQRQFAEITAFNVAEEFRRTLVKPLLGFVFSYLYGLGIPTTVNILNGALKRPVRQMCSDPDLLTECGTPCLSEYSGTPDEKAAIQRGYIERFRPLITVIDTASMAVPFIKRMSTNVDWGDTLLSRVPFMSVATA